ncbi:MAG TPA: winged helix-turn-helix transcriptional regulator [Solirubrobacter sp.]|jgi:DNA-binding HxlR family transcriptional regulator|nr:winged helix-turn-helix transcriptional regulator [Solirubrobacter sp.]
MASRTYGEYCGLAHALELVGERWGLLVIRELIPGPKRFTDLARGLPRIPSNVLSTRLKQLEEAGVVERRVLPRPSGAIVYELTDYGRELDAVLLQLARWGVRSLGEPDPEASVSPASLALGLRAAFQPEAAAGLRATFELHVGEIVVHARVDDGSLEVGEGPAEDPDVTIEADYSLRAVIAGELSPAAAGVRATDERLLDRFAQIFRFAT